MLVCLVLEMDGLLGNTLLFSDLPDRKQNFIVLPKNWTGGLDGD
jgi:hypothetical protein